MEKARFKVTHMQIRLAFNYIRFLTTKNTS